MAICDRCGCQQFYWQEGFVIRCTTCDAPQRKIYQQWHIVSAPRNRYVELYIQASPEFDAAILGYNRIPFEYYELEQTYYPRLLPLNASFNPDRLLQSVIRMRIVLLGQIHTQGWRAYNSQFPILANLVAVDRSSEEVTRNVFLLDDSGNGQRMNDGNTTVLKFVTSADSDPFHFVPSTEERVEVRTFGSDRFVEEVVIRRSGNDYFRQSEAYIVREATRKARPDACVGCANYYGQTHNGNTLVCGIHPYGWQAEGDCLDREVQEELHL